MRLIIHQTLAAVFMTTLLQNIWNKKNEFTAQKLV